MENETVEATEVVEVAEPIEVEVEAVAETETGEATEAAETEKVEPKPDAVQKRFNEMRRKQGDAERRADAAEAALARLTTNTEPDPDQYDDPNDYTKALIRHEAKRAAAENFHENAVETANRARLDSWEERQNVARTTMPDYDSVIGASTTLFAPLVSEALLESEQGPALAYHLASNPELADKIAAMPPVRAIMELSRIEARLTAPAVKTPTNAPDPPRTLGSAQAITRDPAKMSVSDYVAWSNKQRTW